MCGQDAKAVAGVDTRGLGSTCNSAMLRGLKDPVDVLSPGFYHFDVQMGIHSKCTLSDKKSFYHGYIPQSTFICFIESPSASIPSVLSFCPITVATSYPLLRLRVTAVPMARCVSESFPLESFICSRRAFSSENHLSTWLHCYKL